jgi:hypothetical protein
VHVMRMRIRTIDNYLKAAKFDINMMWDQGKGRRESV